MFTILQQSTLCFKHFGLDQCGEQTGKNIKLSRFVRFEIYLKVCNFKVSQHYVTPEHHQILPFFLPFTFCSNGSSAVATFVWTFGIRKCDL